MFENEIFKFSTFSRSQNLEILESIVAENSLIPSKIKRVKKLNKAKMQKSQISQFYAYNFSLSSDVILNVDQVDYAYRVLGAQMCD